MNRNAARGILLAVVLLAVFSAAAFIIPAQRTAVFWIAWVCGVIAILAQVYFFKSGFDGDGRAKSRFYGLPLVRIGILYLAVQTVVSIAEIILSGTIPVWTVLLINLLVLAATLAGCVAIVTARDEIVRQDGKLKKDVSNMRELQALSTALAEQCGDEGLKKALKELADEFRYSDPVSSENTAEAEAELKTGVRDLQQALAEGDTEGAKALCGKLRERLKERNRLCMLNK